MANGTDLLGAFRAYAQKALGNDFNPEKAAAALNTWVKESGDALKERVERETERAVKKLGLAKESDLRALRAEISELRSALGIKTKGKSSGKSEKSAPKKATGKKRVVAKSSAGKTGKKARKSAKKGSPARGASIAKKRSAR